MPQTKDQQIRQLKREVFKKEREIEKLKKLVNKDPLTKLYNRKGFKEEVKDFLEIINFSHTHPEKRKRLQINSASILFFDLDNFKKINDAYGHEAGDQVLRRVSNLIVSKLRLIDIVARWGGEEIVALLVGAKEREAFRKAEEIRRVIKNRIKVPTLEETKVTLSIGVAEFLPGEKISETIRRADQAMYSAKQLGKDKAVCWREMPR